MKLPVAVVTVLNAVPVSVFCNSTAAFDTAESFLESGQRNDVACLVADMRMPGMTGLDLCRTLVAAGNPIPTVLITAYPDEALRARARDAGVRCYLSKPFSPDELCDCVRSALAAQST